MRFVLALLCAFSLANATKIKDISSVLGVRENELTGYGLVIGLNGSGDKSNSKFTMQAIANMLETMNIKVAPADIKSKNVAAVIVSAKLPPFARVGDKIDISVSSLGDAKSLAGGTLVLTPLNAIDGNIYAIAQGQISLNATSTIASLPQSATIEREIVYDLNNRPNATLSLKDADFKNAMNVQRAINAHFAGAATAKDPRTISLTKPQNIGMVEFLSLIGDIDIAYQKSDKIIIDEQSGTIITGREIRISPISISHGEMTIEISNAAEVANPVNLNAANLANPVGAANPAGQNAANPQNPAEKIRANNPTIASLVALLQKIGTSPQNIVAILNAIKKSGAISVEIESI